MGWKAPYSGAATARRRTAENENSRSDSDGTSAIVLRGDAAEPHKIGLVNKSVLWCSYLAVTVVLIQVLSPSVSGSPILLLPENMQGPVSVARNIRHLPCISRRTGDEGVCMFAIDCLKANGSHLGTCIDRFYFGSCCQIRDHNELAPVISNNIEDNTIEGSLLNPGKIDPQTTTEKVLEKPESVKDVLKPEEMDPEHKTESSDEVKKISTVSSVETTTVSKMTNIPSKNTEVPYKISTFQTVVNEWGSTEKSNLTDSVSSTIFPPALSTTSATKPNVNATPLRPKPTQATLKPPFGTKKPQRPSQKPTLKPTFRPTRPSARPSSTTRLPNVTISSTVTRPFSNTTLRPRPTKPVTAFNVTRKPVYKPPPRRPAPTKRPVSQPPKLNITLISQATTLKPGTKPSVTNKPSPSTTHITYINNTGHTPEDKTTTIASSTTAATSTSTKTTSSPTSTTAIINPEVSSQKPVLGTQSPVSEENVPASEAPITVAVSKIPSMEKVTPELEKSTVKVPLVTAPEKVAPEKVTESSFTSTKGEPTKSSTVNIETETEAQILTTKVPENLNMKPLPSSPVEVPEKLTEAPILSTSSTELPPTKIPAEETEVTAPSSENNTSSERPITSTELAENKPMKNEVPVKNTEKPTTSAAPEVTGPSPSSPESSTPYPPGLVTWSTNVDTATKSPEANATTQETWSPIPPPKDWVLMPPVKPKPESTVSPSPTTAYVPSESPSSVPTPLTLPVPETSPIPVTSPAPIPVSSEIPVTSTAEIAVASTSGTKVTSTPGIPVTSTSELPVTSTSELPVTSSSETPVTTPKITLSSSSPVTETTIAEFTVNVTLTPTIPSSTESVGLSTFSSISNVTEAVTLAANFSDNAVNITESSSPSASESSTASSGNVSSTESATPLPHADVNMTNYKDVCGRRLWPEARIVGGTKSGFGRWPWQISLRQWQTSTYLHKCGAALLNENWAITAAHCVERVPPSELLVRLGEHDLAHEAEPYGFAERRVQIVASHPHFDPATFEYDLALLRFYEPVTFQPNILPVCVPESDDNFVGKTAYVTGWGRLYDGGPLPKSLQEVALPVLNNSECEAMYRAAGQFQSIPNIFVCAGWERGGHDGCDEGPLPSVLQEVSVPIINNTACEAMYRAAGYNEHIPNIFICAGWKKGGSDSCEGDSGGPMVLQRADNRFVLGGVISWGIGCAEPNQPGVYTRISEFRDWINQILQF